MLDRARGRTRAAARPAAARSAGEARALLSASGTLRGARLPAAGRRLRRVVPRRLRTGDSRSGSRCCCRCRRRRPVLLRCPWSGLGRIAGQFAKPRTSPTEVVKGVRPAPSFRGHIVHSDEPTAEARVPYPQRLVQGYYQSVSTLNLLRAFTKGGFADLTLCPQLESRVRRRVTLRPALRGPRSRDRARAPVHAGDRLRPAERADDPRRWMCGRATKRSAPRLRGAPYPSQLADAGLPYSLPGAHALDRLTARATAGGRSGPILL